jgi:hypothetical protein
MAEVEQFAAVAAQLARQSGGGGPLGDAPEDQHQRDGPPLGALQERPGEGVEDPLAGRATVVEHRGAVTAVDAQSVACPAPGAG